VAFHIGFVAAAAHLALRLVDRLAVELHGRDRAGDEGSRDLAGRDALPGELAAPASTDALEIEIA
jgi:hypothetical protein